MELRHLRYFAAVADTLNYRAASARLNLSAPALSKQVRDLEEELGVRLFDRDTAHVRLTNAGQVFLTEARQIIAHAERAIDQTREAAKGRRGRLVVGNVGPLTAGYMAEAVTAFCARYPEVEVELADIELPAQLGALEKRAIDIGFTTARAIAVAPLPARFQHVAVLTTPLGVALPAEHALARERAVSFVQLVREKLLCITGDGTTNSHRGYILELMAARGLKPERLSEVRGYESLLAMIASGQGVSILAGRSSLLRVEGIVMRPFKDAAADTDLELHAVWCGGTAGVVAEHFIKEFRLLARAKLSRAASAKPSKRRARR